MTFVEGYHADRGHQSRQASSLLTHVAKRRPWLPRNLEEKVPGRMARRTFWAVPPRLHSGLMTTPSLRLVTATALLWAARRYFRNWGTTKEEHRMRLPGDELVAAPVDQTTEAVWIDAPASMVWPWLVQMGQDRGGLYTFERLENLAGLSYCNADRIHPEWQQLDVGDTVRLVPKGWLGLRDGVEFEVVEIQHERTIVLQARFPYPMWDVVWSFHLIPYGQDRCRLLIRIRTPLRRPGQVLVTELGSPGTAFVTRGILLGVKRRAQQQFQAEASAERASGDLHRMVSSDQP